jgi:hypothetical protein
MSGRKQHFIPQFLLRQFAADEVRKTKSIRVWVHPAEGNPYLTATEGVAAQRHFYSDVRDDGVETLDDIITRYEGRFASLLRSITDLPVGGTVDASHAAEVVSHLAIRNAHLRHGVSALVQGIAEIAVEAFGSNENLTRHLGLNELLPGSTFDKYFNDRLGDLPPELTSSFPEGLVRLMAFALARENIGHVADSQVEMLFQVLRGFSMGVGAEIRDVHNQTLGKGDLEIPHGFITASPIKEWTIIEPSESVILPDCAAIGIKEGGESGPLLFSGGKELRCVILPISASKVLVGRSLSYGWPSPQILNELAAESSDKFFVSSVNSHRTRTLQERMGTASSRMFAELITLASGVLDPPPAEEVLPTYDFQPRTNDLESGPTLDTYAVSFLDFISEFPAQEVANEIGLVVSELKEVVSLDRLAGFTFAHDYERALAELDRGFEASVPLTTISPEFGRGLFLTPLVVRDGHAKFQVVARAEMAYGLIDEVKPNQEFYCYGLIRALGNVGYSGLLEASSPGSLLGRFGDNVDGGRFNAVDNALMCYFSCRMAAPVHPTIISDHIKLLTDTAKISDEKIRGVIESHWQSPDFEAVGQSAMYYASLLFDRFSEVAGTLAGTSRSHVEFEALTSFLRESQLEAWFSIFCQDLDRWWRSQGEWKYPKTFGSYAIHFDRLTWALSLPFWKDQELGWQVFVPNPPGT